MRVFFAVKHLNVDSVLAPKFQASDASVLMIPIFVLANLHFLLLALMLLSHSNDKNQIRRHFYAYLL